MILVALAYLLAFVVIFGMFAKTPLGEPVKGHTFTIALCVLLLSGVTLAVAQL